MGGRRGRKGWLWAGVLVLGLLGVRAGAGEEDLRRCGRCHAFAWITYSQEFHGAAGLRGDPRMPTCLTCHGSKSIVRPINLKSPEPEKARTNSFKLCKPCHPALGSNPRLAAGLVAYHQDLSLLGPLEYAGFPRFWRHFPGKPAWALRSGNLLAVIFLTGLALIHLTLLWARLFQKPEAGLDFPESPPASISGPALGVVILVFGLTLTAWPLLWPENILSDQIAALFGSALLLRQTHKALGLILVLLLFRLIWRQKGEIEFLAPLFRVGRMLAGLKSGRRLLKPTPLAPAGDEALFRLEPRDVLNLLLLPASLVAVAGGLLWSENLSLRYFPKWALDALLAGHGIGGLALFVWVVDIHFGLGVLRPWLSRLAQTSLTPKEKPDAAN